MQYWNSLPEDKRSKQMDDNCRHRFKYQAPPTPENYWEVEFPTTQQCIQRGYGGVIAVYDKDDSMGTKRPRRKRPLRLLDLNKNDNDEGDDDDNDATKIE